MTGRPRCSLRGKLLRCWVLRSKCSSSTDNAMLDRRGDSVGIHQRPPGIPTILLPTCWPPSPCGRLSRPPTTTKPPPHPTALSRRRACPPASWPDRREGDRGWFPRSPRTDRRGRCPAAPRPLRHRYAAGIPHGLPTGLFIPASESPVAGKRRTCTAHRPRSTRFESARRLRSFHRWFLSYTFSSRLADPPRLAVPGRPVVVRTASRPPRRLPDQSGRTGGLLRRSPLELLGRLSPQAAQASREGGSGLKCCALR
jgi:hypothetical protein